MDQNTTFSGGVNIALKIPKHVYEQTVAFYRDILKLEIQEESIDNPTVSRTHHVTFGPNTVWLDCVDNYTHAEAWLEINAPDVAAATDYLRSQGVITKDEFEQIPADTVMIVSAPERSGAYAKEKGNG